ncbi:hypothetical protein BJ742DRAFT_798162 [Cladochytrium replicatum]|nr:hypothetical protein BJ742DRAFT_798162 [Cladochytrium replicatum]
MRTRLAKKAHEKNVIDLPSQTDEGDTNESKPTKRKAATKQSRKKNGSAPIDLDIIGEDVSEDSDGYVLPPPKRAQQKGLRSKKSQSGQDENVKVSDIEEHASKKSKRRKVEIPDTAAPEKESMAEKETRTSSLSKPVTLIDSEKKLPKKPKMDPMSQKENIVSSTAAVNDEVVPNGASRQRASKKSGDTPLASNEESSAELKRKYEKLHVLHEDLQKRYERLKGLAIETGTDVTDSYKAACDKRIKELEELVGKLKKENGILRQRVDNEKSARQDLARRLDQSIPKFTPAESVSDKASITQEVSELKKKLEEEQKKLEDQRATSQQMLHEQQKKTDEIIKKLQAKADQYRLAAEKDRKDKEVIEETAQKLSAQGNDMRKQITQMHSQLALQHEKTKLSDDQNRYQRILELSVRLYEDVTKTKVVSVVDGYRVTEDEEVQVDNSKQNRRRTFSIAAATSMSVQGKKEAAIIYRCRQEIGKAVLDYSLTTAVQAPDFYIYSPVVTSVDRGYGLKAPRGAIGLLPECLQEESEFDCQHLFAFNQQLSQAMLEASENLV